MSKENVEVVRRGYGALNSRDFSRIPEFLDPNVEIDVSRNVINPSRSEGHEAFERAIRATDDVWDDFRSEPQEFVDAGDHVVVAVRLSGTGAGSGVVAQMDVFNVFTLEHGKIVRVVGGIQTRAETFELAGLSE
jgi:ketosteroid isomerase-like protein